MKKRTAAGVRRRPASQRGRTKAAVSHVPERDYPHVTFQALDVPKAVPEYRFHPTRRWRWDWAWPEEMVALEINGGIFNYGRHNRATGYLRDMEKLREAACLGWRVVGCTPQELTIGKAAELVKRCLDGNQVGHLGEKERRRAALGAVSHEEEEAS